MKLSGGLLMLRIALTSAAPTLLEAGSDVVDFNVESRGLTSVVARAGVTIEDNANDWDNIIAGKAQCQPVGVIFARGTFDDG